MYTQGRGKMALQRESRHTCCDNLERRQDILLLGALQDKHAAWAVRPSRRVLVCVGNWFMRQIRIVEGSRRDINMASSTSYQYSTRLAPFAIRVVLALGRPACRPISYPTFLSSF